MGVLSQQNGRPALTADQTPGIFARIAAMQNPGYMVAQGINKITNPGYPVDDALRGWANNAPAFQPTLGGVGRSLANNGLNQTSEFLTALQRGDIDAVMNSSLFPMAGMAVMKGPLRVVPAKESLLDVADSNFSKGIPAGDKTVGIDTLKGGMSASSSDAKKVKALIKQMSGDDGYIERLIVDQHGNVIEGQHRLKALRAMGVKDVPVSVITDHSATYDALVSSGLRPEHARNIVDSVSDMLNESGSVAKVMAEYEFPKGYESAFETALKKMAKERVTR